MTGGKKSSTRRPPPSLALPFRPILLLPVLAALLAGTTACFKGKPEEPTVSVQVESAAKRTMERTVVADAILFPLHQPAIVPKISAAVKKCYVKRVSRVRKGQLLAILENRDLAAAAEENKGVFEQA